MNPDDHDEDDTPAATRPATSLMSKGGENFLRQSAQPTVADGANAEIYGAAARALIYAKVRKDV